MTKYRERQMMAVWEAIWKNAPDKERADKMDQPNEYTLKRLDQFAEWMRRHLAKREAKEASK